MKNKMGCNCKARNNYEKFVSKYGEMPVENNENKLNINYFFKVCIQGILQILMGILLCVLFIIISIPLVFYIGGCIVLGKEAHVKLFRFNKKRNE